MRKIRLNNGFTFIEVMVALAVLALILTAVFRLYTQSVSMLLLTGFELKAPLLAKKIISEKKNNDDDNYSDSGSFEGYFSNFKWAINANEVLISFKNQDFGEEIKNIKIKKVLVTISNTDKREYKTFFYVESKN